MLVDKEWTRRGGEQGEEHSVLPVVKSGGLEGIIGQRVDQQGCELREEHSDLPGVKSGGLEGFSEQRVDQQGW